MNASQRLVATLLLSLPSLGAAAEDAVVLLADGQTISGQVTVEPDGAVRIQVAGRDGATGFEVTLAPEAVEKVLPAGSLRREALPRALVELQDGRELRGEVLADAYTVIVRGPYGQVEVARADVVGVRPEEPEPPRTCADADLGLVLRIPDGWLVDDPGGVGERLRLVRADGRVRLSVLVRRAPTSGSPLQRVREALESDLTRAGKVSPGPDDLMKVEDAPVDHAARGRPLRVTGRAELRGELVVWYRVEMDGQEELEAGLAEQLERWIPQRRWLDGGRSPDGTFFRDEALRVAIEAPPGWKVVAPDGAGEVARLTGPNGGVLRVHAIDDPDLEAGLRDLLEEEPEQVVAGDAGSVALVRSKAARERGLAWGWGGKTVVVVARAQRAEELARLTTGVLLIDPEAPLEEAKDATALAPRRAAARQALADGDPEGALSPLADVLATWPDDPEALGLRVAAIRDRAAPLELVGALDDAWYALGSPWVAEELGSALLEQAREAVERKDMLAANGAYARAAEVWPDEQTCAEVERWFVVRAKEALKAGDRAQAWTRLATARKLLGGLESLDAAEAGMRLEAARALLEAKDPQGARREARKAWQLGADDKPVDQIYARAEALERSLEQAREAERARRAAARGSGGGLEFGIPPSRTSGSGSRRVRPSSMVSGGKRGNRVRAVNYTSGRSRRVRPAFSSDSNDGGSRRVRTRSNGGGRRVRSNGRFVFE